MTASLREFLDGLTLGNVATTLVDVALVYYLIYRLLLTIRGTRAAQMVVGIVLVGAAFFVAARLELSTVSWLLDNFISYFIILIIVVFQQDIRRALGRIGQNVLPFGACCLSPQEGFRIPSFARKTMLAVGWPAL